MSTDDFQSDPAVARLPYDHVIFTDLDGFEGVLVDLNTRKYYQLNETASLVWRGLEKRLPVSKIAGEMTDLYDVTLDRATASVEQALRDFSAQKLIRPG